MEPTAVNYYVFLVKKLQEKGTIRKAQRDRIHATALRLREGFSPAQLHEANKLLGWE